MSEQLYKKYENLLNKCLPCCLFCKYTDRYDYTKLDALELEKLNSGVPVEELFLSATLHNNSDLLFCNLKMNFFNKDEKCTFFEYRYNKINDAYKWQKEERQKKIDAWKGKQLKFDF